MPLAPRVPPPAAGRGTPCDPQPVELNLWPERAATPVEGCATCAELVTERVRARAQGDMSAVSDCNVLLRRHRDGHR